MAMTEEQIAAERERLTRRLDASVHSALVLMTEDEVRAIVEGAITTRQREAEERAARHAARLAADRERPTERSPAVADFLRMIRA